MDWLHRLLMKFKPYKRLLAWTKRAILPGFGSLPLYTVFEFFFEEIARESILNKASSLAYSFMLAIFPGIIFLFTLIPYIPIDNFQEQLMELIKVVIPHNAFESMESTLNEVVKKQNGGLLSLGFILCTYFASNGMTTLMMAFNKAALCKEDRSWGKRRFVAIFLSFSIVTALAIGIGLYAGTNYLLNYFKNHIEYDLTLLWRFLFLAVRWLTLFGVYYFTVSLVFKFGPSNYNQRTFFTTGAVVATLLAIFSFSAFAFYINNFNTYNKVYGSIGTLIVVMIWLYINALILIIGFELNAAITLSNQKINDEDSNLGKIISDRDEE